MSTPTVPSSSPNNPTRQLLDELDALMERMLALPINDGEEEALPLSRSLLFREPAFPAEAKSIMPTPTAARIEAPPRLSPIEIFQPTAVPSTAGPTTRPASASVPPTSTAPAIPPVTAATTTSPVSVLSPPRWSPKGMLAQGLGTTAPIMKTAWWMQPILWSNRVFDRATLRLGPAGRWLRGENGRTLLGWTGAVLLVLALTCLILDVLGWNW